MLTNFVITALALGSAVYLVRGDVRHGSVMLKRNLKTIRSWLEAEGAASGAPKPSGPPKHLEPPGSSKAEPPR